MFDVVKQNLLVINGKVMYSRWQVDMHENQLYPNGDLPQYHLSKQAGSCAKSLAKVGINVPILAICNYSNLQNLGNRARVRAV